MNFLAHVYLSGDDDEIKIGNFVADWIKGSDFKKYSPGIQKGILLHRSIDWFTDNHPIVKQSKSKLAVDYGKYAGIIIDIFYDHFLAKNWDRFSRVPLTMFAQDIYLLMGKNVHMFPSDIQEFVPNFCRRRWLESYATIDGIERVLAGMSRHTSLPNHTTAAIQILRDSYNDFTTEFFDYFPLLVSHVEEKFEIVVA